LNVYSVAAFLMSTGRLFHRRGAATPLSGCIQQQTGNKLATILLPIQETCWRRQVMGTIIVSLCKRGLTVKPKCRIRYAWSIKPPLIESPALFDHCKCSSYIFSLIYMTCFDAVWHHFIKQYNVCMSCFGSLVGCINYFAYHINNLVRRLHWRTPVHSFKWRRSKW